MGSTNTHPQTFLAADTFIRGDMHFTSSAQLAGHIEGRIESDDALDIAPSAVIEGDIVGALIEVHGTVKGNIYATRACRLGPTARVTGEIRAANLAIAEGASFIGQVCVGTEKADAAPAPLTPPTAAAPIAAPAATVENPRAAELFAPASIAAPAPAPHHPAETPIAFPSRIEQIVREEEPAAVASAEAMTTSSPTVRIMTQNVQQTLQRGPRIIKAR